MSVAQLRQMIGREHPGLAKAAQCRLVSVSRSSFYYAPVAETKEDAGADDGIDASFLDDP